MTDDDFEPRLRRMLAGRANQVNPDLDGPSLRARAGERPGLAHRAAAPLLIAASVAVIAIVAQLVSSHPGTGHREPPGASVTAPHSSAPPATPTQSPTAAPSSSATGPFTIGSPSSPPSSTVPGTPPPYVVSTTPSTARIAPPGSVDIPSLGTSTSN